MAKAELRAVISADASKFMRKMRNVKAAALGAGVALGTYGVNAAMKFGKGMAEVSTLVDMSKEEFAAFTRSARSLGKELGLTHDELTQGLYNALSAGVPPENVIDYLRTAAKAGIGGVADLGTAVTGLSTIIDTYAMSQQDANTVADLFFTAVKNGKTTFPELAENIGRVSASAAAMGISVQDLFSDVTTLTKSLKTTEAMTAYKSLLAEITRSGSDLGGAIEDATGASSAMAAVAEHGVAGALDMVYEALGGNAEKLRELVPSQEAYAAMVGLTGNAAGTAKANLDAMIASAGASERAFAKMADTPSHRLDVLLTKAQDAAIGVGEAILPTLEDVTSTIDKTLGTEENIESMAQAFEGLAISIQAAIKPLIALYNLGSGFSDYVADKIDNEKGWIDKAKGAAVSVLAGGVTNVTGEEMTAAQKAAALHLGMSPGSIDPSNPAMRQVINEQIVILRAIRATLQERLPAQNGASI